ncbi:hypothetical protein Leryth_005275 [Lithospermum erythrorhizon]|nr:hypothetical protein Leryth_005275 [Lithospermum erythrorhizon]
MASTAAVAASNVSRRLEGKVALITGAASGIGKVAARVFSQQGAKVVIADIQRASPKKKFDILYPNTSFIHCDVTQESDLENAVNSTVSKNGKLDIMFNNAGISGSHKNIVDLELSEFKKIIDVNLLGVFLGIKHAARVMIPRRHGTIINMASVATVISGSSPHAYTSSKHAVVGLTKNMAVELGRHGIRVNCLSPSMVPTPMALEFLKVTEEELRGVTSTLEGASLTTEDVAEAALYLASDESKYVTGQNLVVDGGLSIVNPKFSIFGQRDYESFK